MNTGDFRRKRKHIPIAYEGLPYILTGVFVTWTMALLGHGLLAWAFLALTLLTTYFFRDPVRWGNAGPDSVVSPADGKVIVVESSLERQFTGQACHKISIFMSVFNVHVNRAPISGTVRDVRYRKGRYLCAHKDEAGRENEQNWLHIVGENRRQVVLTQVAGLIARRIVCWPSVNDEVEQGERFGMVRFGSRLDVYVFGDCDIMVKKGDHVFAGESILCQMK